MAKFKGKILKWLECDDEFKVSPNRVKTAKYCSKECADVHRHDTTRVNKIEKKCLRCGKIFYDHPCHAKRRKFCSYYCVNKDYEERCGGRGDSHFYNRTLWRKLRKEVLVRDGYNCTKCGYHAERYLQVHHINLRRIGGDDEVGNLVTLCNSCHKKIHWTM
jgi:hypothetical protein